MPTSTLNLTYYTWNNQPNISYLCSAIKNYGDILGCHMSKTSATIYININSESLV